MDQYQEVGEIPDKEDLKYGEDLLLSDELVDSLSAPELSESIEESPFTEMPEEPEPPLMVSLEVMNVVPVAPHHVPLLETMFKKEKIDPKQSCWVSVSGDDFLLLINPASRMAVNNPQELGYKILQHPVLTLLSKGLGALAHYCFKIPLTQDVLKLPNGANVHLVVQTWQDHLGHPAKLMKIRQMPDNAWVIQKDTLLENVIPFENSGKLKQEIQTQIELLERSGKVRETLKPIAVTKEAPPAKPSKGKVSDSPFESKTEKLPEAKVEIPFNTQA